jgi:imidazolonepropionase-like amidohydrolase/ABC-type transport system involved in cytochrome c biogenesis permease component
MKGYIALIEINLKLALREKAVLFFNYVFPLMFFFGFGQMMGGQSGAITRVVTMVLVIGILGSGLFGAGIRAVAEREANILRRYKVAPISPAPILVASMVTGWILYMPSVLILLTLAHFYYGMPVPERWLSLLVLVSVGSFAMRAIGLIVASVVNSIAESNILIQVMYMPMLFLSGATIPLAGLPSIAQIISQFLPASHLFSGMQGILLRNETIVQNGVSALALLSTAFVATLISVKLFRWEKEEKIGRSAKLWLVAVFLPFLILGSYQAYSKENIEKGKMYERDFRRSRTRLIRGARIFVGDGKVIESGAVLIKNGIIEEIYDTNVPDAKAVNAELVEAIGKTILPGLIDVHVHLGAPGGLPVDQKDYNPKGVMDRNLAAYLYSGVTAVKSTGDFIDEAINSRSRIQRGEKLGAELFLCGPLFTTEGGHGTEYFKHAPDFVKKLVADQFIRTPKNAAEAKEQVEALAARKVDGIKAILEGGVAGMLFNRMDIGVLQAIAQSTHSARLPLVVHTGDAKDVADAIAAQADGIEHGSARDSIPDETFAKMVKQGVAYDPTLSVMEAFTQFAEGKTDLLDRSLVAQAAPAGLIQNTKKQINSSEMVKTRQMLKIYTADLPKADDNLLRAYKAGVLLVTGSDAGNMLVLHGPTVHRELQLWVQAGIPPKAALQAATYNAAKLLRADKRMGLISKGYEANILIVDGNPLQDISNTERISIVFFKGERIDRSGLFDQR